MSDPRPNAYDRWVRAERPAKAPVTAERAVGAWVEDEVLPDGRPGRVGVVILANRECPYSCVFCGLWRDTTDATPAPGQVARQVAAALERFGPVDAIKLYNAGSFFDPLAMTDADREAIASLCRHLGWVIVESRPEMADRRCVEWASRLGGRLEVAIGLEVADDRILALLNKRMRLRQCAQASVFLREHGIGVRAFVMVKPPLVPERRAAGLAVDTARWAIDHGATTVSLIPSYMTPGAMERLAAAGFFRPPRLWSVYEAAQGAVALRRAVVVVDTWNLQTLRDCPACFDALRDALRALNRTGRLPRAHCSCREAYEAAREAERIGGPEAYARWLKEQMRTPAVLRAGTVS